MASPVSTSTPKKEKIVSHKRNTSGFKKRNKGFTPYKGKVQKRKPPAISEISKINNTSDRQYGDDSFVFEDIVPLDDIDDCNVSVNINEEAVEFTCTKKLKTDGQELINRRIKQITEKKLVEALVKKLGEHDLFHDFLQLMTVLSDGRLPMKNIAFLACLDRAVFAALASSTNMRYRIETRAFWELLFKYTSGMAMRLLSGPMNRGHVQSGKHKRSQYPPTTSLCNFKIPTSSMLTSTDIDKRIKPGFIDSIIKLVPKDKQYILAFDGKNINDGLSKEYGCGDINLWGYEGPPNLTNAKLKHDRTVKMIKDIAEQHAYRRLPDLLQALSFRIKELRILLANFYRLKLKLEKASENKKERYANALGTIAVNIFTGRSLVTRLLAINKRLTYSMASLHDNLDNYETTDKCEIDVQPNCRRLLPATEVEKVYPLNVYPQLCKQGSDQWFDLRKQARVTGSSLYKSLGFRSVAEMKSHYKEFIEEDANKRVVPQFTEDQLSNFEYGKQNEINGVATLISTLVPALLPKCFWFLECGAYFIDGSNVPNLIEVSPDGLLSCSSYNCDEWDVFSNHQRIAVEIKCPVPKEKDIVRLHYTVPKWYVFQIQAEMAVLEAEKAWYVCYTPESTTLIEVRRDAHLWNRIYKMVDSLLGSQRPTMLKKLPDETKELKEQLDNLVSQTCVLLAEVPSVKATNTVLKGDINEGPHSFPMSFASRQQNMEEIVNHLGEICVESLKLVNECFELHRKKATEMVTFVLSDTDRMYTDGVALNFPIAYALKGYSMTCDVMRKMLEDVRVRLYKEGIDVLCEAYDGQWMNVMVRDKEGKPLTRFQVAKDTFKDVIKLPKEELLLRVNQLSSVSQTTIHSMSRMHPVADGKFYHGNITVEVEPPEQYPCEVPTHISQGTRSFIVHSNSGMCDMQRITFDSHPKLWNMDPKKKTYSIMEEHETIIDYLPRHLIDESKHSQIQMAREEDVIIDLDDTIIYGNEDIDNIMFNEHTIDINVQNAQLERENVLQDTIDEGNMSFLPSDLSELDMSFRRIPQEKTPVPAKRKETADIQNEYMSIQKQSEIQHLFKTVGMDFLKTVLAKLRDMPKQNKKLVNIDENGLLVILSDANKIYTTLRKEDLCLIEADLRVLLNVRFFKSSMTKAQMCNIIGRLFGSFNLFDTKKVVMKSLKSICKEEINKSLYPKKVIAASYGRAVNVQRLAEWEHQAPIPMSVHIKHQDRMLEMYSYPEYNSERKQFEPRILDPTHLVTNIRSMATMRGLPELGVRRQAWLDVCKYYPHILSLGYITEVAEKQSAAIARQVFSQNVEICMEKLGHYETATFVHHVRNFYDACDAKHVNIDDRIRYLTEMQDYLLNGLDLHYMPPPGTHLKSLSITTFEGILQNCSTRIQASIYML